MDRFEVGFRPAPPTAPIPTESDPGLVTRIRGEIAAGGPITFARFMELALYDPAAGYYRGEAERPGRDGDFLTAPDLHPVFGAAVARQLEEVWRRMDRPDRFVLREYGAGSGALGLAALMALAGQGRLGSVAGSPGLAAAIRYAPIEINAHRRAQLAERFAAAGFAGSLAPDPDPSQPMTGVVVANEFLDAFPVHRVEQVGDELRELWVDWGGTGFVEVIGPPSSPALSERLASEGVRLGPDARAEICLTLDPWLHEVAHGLERGAVLVVDYGHPAAALYAPERAAGTLLAYAGHRAHDDWSIAIGRQDLTAHVDFTAVERGAVAAGLEVLGRTTQAEFLVGCGLDELVDAVRSDPATTMEAWLGLRSAIARLLDPRALGGFGVLVLGRELAADPPLRGLAVRLRR